MNVVARTRPLIAVVFSVPLFVEALLAAFEGLADLQALRSADAGLEGLLRVLQPDALIAESAGVPSFDLDIPTVHVDLERQQVFRCADGDWRLEQLELSGEAIRNLILEIVYGGVVR
jgi:hypothetical protein